MKILALSLLLPLGTADLPNEPKPDAGAPPPVQALPDGGAPPQPKPKPKPKPRDAKGRHTQAVEPDDLVAPPAPDSHQRN